mmetsp:Transcript_138221/g.240514  ORF Transcript_138221/g.240514 Transcript_138221/m.240514 type:complete len:119 (-) Transcript_138221:528-884(-)
MGCGAVFGRKPLTPDLRKEIEELFDKIVDKGDAQTGVTKQQAESFFKGKFGKLSAAAMFNEVDVDNSGNITKDEWVGFWAQVKKSGYSEEDIQAELTEMKNGTGQWVDWKDGRDVSNK